MKRGREFAIDGLHVHGDVRFQALLGTRSHDGLADRVIGVLLQRSDQPQDLVGRPFP